PFRAPRTRLRRAGPAAPARAEPPHRHRQKPPRVLLRRARCRVQTIAILDNHDGAEQDRQDGPDGDEAATTARRAQCCFHHTAVPITASIAGTSATDRKNVPFIWRLVSC